MSPPYVKKSRAGKLTGDRIVELLADKLPGELDSELNRDADDVTDNGNGVYVPDPGSIYRKVQPTQNDVIEMVDDVALYVGTGQTPDRRDFSLVSAGGELVNVSWSWAVNFVIRPQGGMRPTVADPVQPRDFVDHEVLGRRARNYADVIQHTLSKWGHVGSAGNDRDDAINEVELGESMSTVTDFGGSPTQKVLRGAGYVQVEIFQFQLLPDDQYT